MSIDLIMGLGDDQLANQFVVLFPTGIPGGGNSDEVTLRMEEEMPMPDDAVGEYLIEYQGMQILKTSQKETTDKHFEMTVRVDTNWNVYKTLKKWKDMAFDPKTGIAMPEALTRTTLVVQALDGQKSVKKNFTFKYVKLQKIQISGFSHTSEDPTKLTLGFIYGYME